MSDALTGLYENMKRALEDAGGYEALSEEQRDLFNVAVDALMAAKFEHAGAKEAEAAVTAWLDTMRPEAEPLPEEEEGEGEPITGLASLLIRAADALDRAGERELANQVDTILGRLGQ
jgi:hypothetical protein